MEGSGSVASTYLILQIRAESMRQATSSYTGCVVSDFYRCDSSNSSLQYTHVVEPGSSATEMTPTSQVHALILSYHL